mgnify:CR=1 FL=1
MSNEISAAQFNPYVRLVNRLENAEHDTHIVPWRILYDFEIIFVTKGRLQVLKDETDYYVEEGCLHIMPPFIRHTRLVPAGVLTNYFSVHCDFLFDESSPDFSALEVYKEPCDKKMRTVPVREELTGRKDYQLEIVGLAERYPVKNKNTFVELFNKLYLAFCEQNESREGQMSGAVKTKAYMMLIIAEFLEELRTAGQKSPDGTDYIAQFIDYTMNHYFEEIDLNLVVKQYGISPSRFRTIFKSQLNKAPLAYVIDYRIEQAKKLLLTGQYPVSKVSYMVGYDDIHYFSRLFKQKAGCSPSEFAKRNMFGTDFF